MYINNELVRENIGLYRIMRFMSNIALEEYNISYLNNFIIIRRYEMIGNDTYIHVLKIKCTQKQHDKIRNMLNNVLAY